MTWTVGTTFKTTLATAVDTLLTGGTLRIKTGAAGTTLCDVSISSITDNGDGTVTVNYTASAAGLATGTAAYAEFRTSGGTVVLSTTSVGTSASDVNLDSLSIDATKVITVTSSVITFVSMVES